MANIDIDKLYKRWVDTIGENRLTLKWPSLKGLHSWFLRQCQLKGVDPEAIDFEAYIDPSLSYEENKTILAEMIGAPPTEEEFGAMYEQLKGEMQEQVRKKYPEILEPLEERIAELEREADKVKRYKELVKELRYKLEETERKLEQERAKPPEVAPVKLRILRDFEHGIERYRAGDVIETRDVDWALGLIEKGYGERVPVEVPVVKAPPPKPREAPPEEIFKPPPPEVKVPPVKLLPPIPETCPICVPPNTIVSGGFKPISEVGVGERVLGLSGHVQALKLLKRAYAGPIIKIEATGLLPITLTPEHPILISEGKQPYPKGGKVQFSGFRWKLPKGIREKHEMRDGDYLVIHKPPKHISIGQIDLRRYMKAHGVKTALGKKLPIEFPINPETAWLLGLYVAEGCPGSKGVIFYLGLSEKALAEKVIRIGRQIGYSPCIRKAVAAQAVEIPSRVLARAFPDWCGKGARNKRVPNFIMYHKSDVIVRAFLKGYYEGDGTKSPKKCKAQMNTSSKTLALQLQLLYTRFNIMLIITQYRPGNVILGNKVETVPHHFLLRYYGDGRPKRAKFLRNYVLAPVRRVTETFYNGEVCNLATEDETYVISNVIVHNCGTSIEQMERVPMLIRDPLRLSAEEEYWRARMGMPLPTVSLEWIDVPPTMKIWMCKAEPPHYFERDAAGRLGERTGEFLYTKILRETAKMRKITYPPPMPYGLPPEAVFRPEKLKPPGASPKRWLLETKGLTWGEFLRLPDDKRKELLDEYTRLSGEEG